jgi:hypothetical protein
VGRVSCIEHPARSRFVQLRDSYMELCDGDACAALLLADFVGWTDHRLSGQEERGGDVWIYRSREELRDDLCGAFGLGKIDAALELLMERGFLKRRRNPKLGWDRKWQYLLNVPAVQRAINRLRMHPSISEDGASRSDDGLSDFPASMLGNPTSNTQEPNETPRETSTQEQPRSEERVRVGTTRALSEDRGTP